MKKFLCYDTNDAASGKINVDSRGMLNPNSTVPSTNGTPYQQLVTDDEGNTKWEDRLAYDDSKLVVDSGKGFQYVKVADEVPSWASVDSPIKLWLSTGYDVTGNPGDYVEPDNGSFLFAQGFAAFILTDNTLITADRYNALFPEKGVYFASVPGNFYTTGIASADSDTPEITWDGNIGEVKKIDEKFLPDDRFVVTFTETEDGNVTSDKTFSEIFDAYKAGRKVFGVILHAPNDWTELYVSAANGDEIDFFTIVYTSSGCMYFVVRVSRTGGNSFIAGLLTQQQPVN